MRLNGITNINDFFRLFKSKKKNPEFDSAKKLNEYKSYLDFELKKITDLEKQKIKQNNKSNNETLAEEASTALTHQRERLKCLFERSLSDDSNCLDVALWLKYIHYLVSRGLKRTY